MLIIFVLKYIFRIYKFHTCIKFKLFSKSFSLFNHTFPTLEIIKVESKVGIQQDIIYSIVFNIHFNFTKHLVSHSTIILK